MYFLQFNMPNLCVPDFCSFQSWQLSTSSINKFLEKITVPTDQLIYT